MQSIFNAFALLSTFPIPKKFMQKHSVDGIDNSAWAYPIVGLVIGLILALVIVASAYLIYVPTPLILVVLVILPVLFTGALHYDGLADTVDGIFAKNTPEKRLEVMKDSNIGTFAAIAICNALIIEYIILNDILTVPLDAALVIISVNVSSRCTMSILQATTNPARKSGLLASISEASYLNGIIAFGITFVINIMLTGIFYALVINIIIILITMFARSYSLKKINGITGDILGATNIITHIILLLAFYCIIANKPTDIFINSIVFKLFY